LIDQTGVTDIILQGKVVGSGIFLAAMNDFYLPKIPDLQSGNN
jgi:hypothetical protein